jgi:Sec-independent protein translocase protein TatA
MEILGIGPLELLFILLIALIILGPGDMVKAGRTLGRILRKIITSSEYRTIQKASRELRYLPNRLMREASIEDLNKDLQDINKIGGQISSEVKKVEMDLSSWTTPPDLTEPSSENDGQENPEIDHPEVTSSSEKLSDGG